MKALILSFVTASLLCTGSTRADEHVPPNILFILADDMGWQDTSVPFGPERTLWNERYRTPGLEKMAREGMKFTQAYACAVCSPTRVSLMTGQNEARHGVTQWTYLSGEQPTSDLAHPTLSHADWNWNGLQPAPGMRHAISVPTLPSLLKQSGYRTMHFGKGHFGAADTPGADPKTLGFDVRIGGRDAGGCGSYYGLQNFGAKAHPNGPWRAWDLDHYFGQDIHLTEALTREAQREIRSAVNAGQPFFCYFAHYAPHTPIKPDERFAPKYRDAGLDETEAAYASLIEGLDKSVGDLLALLDELGIADNTLVVFTSDNGGVSHAYRSMAPPHTHNRPLSSGKGSHHEGGIRVPLLVRWPGVTEPATTCNTPVMVYDWFPTLLEAAGTSPPDLATIDGLDLRALLQGRPDKAFDRPLAWHFPNFWGPLNGDPIEGPGMGPSSTLRCGDWKLIYYHVDQRFELFDLAHDVGEQCNLAAEEPVRVLELASELTRVLKLHQAPMPRVKATGKPVPLPIEALRLADSVAAESALPVAIRRDWLFQAEQRPDYRHALQQVERARELAERLRVRFGTLDLAVELADLDRWNAAIFDSQSLDDADDGAAESLYLAVRAVKRRIMLKHPAIDFSRLLFIDQPYPRFPTGRPWPHDRNAGQICRHENSHRNGMMATPGGRLLILDELDPEAEVRELGPPAAGSYWRPDLSFDARRVLFCFKPEQDKAFHLYEVGIDDRGLRQLTFGDYDDIDPIYLPDGHIMFVTTRCHTYVRCMPHANSYVLARCDEDGKNIYLVSQSNECDWLPALLDDGRVVYSRWEYTDKPLWRVQSLWTTNPDGTNTAVVWGNQSVWPDHLAQPRPIPGTHRVMFTGVGHHDWFAGSIGIVDPRVGREFPAGLTKVTADIAWPEVGNGPVDPIELADYLSPGLYDAYQTPYPLSEDLFLVSARRSQDDKFRLYLMDLSGNLELIYEGQHNIWHAMPVKPRHRPPEQPDRVRWPGTGSERREAEPGFFYSADVLEGAADLPRDRVKYLRVFQQEYTTFSDGMQTTRWGGPCVSVVQEDGVKRILGTVPVNEDGSVYFPVPAGKMLYFQLLDEHYRALQTMRSFTGAMPGETRGCVGCHEMHSTAPPNQPAFAVQQPPVRPTPPPWGDETIGYERFVQPVLERYCVECHRGDTTDSHPPDLRLRPGYSFMKQPYLTLIGPAIWIEPRIADLPVPDPRNPGVGLAGILRIEAFVPDEILEPFKWHNQPKGGDLPVIRMDALVGKYATLRAMTALSYRSPLIQIAMSGEHHGVKVDDVSLRRLIAWVDAMGPYRGLEEIRGIPDADFEGIEELAIRPRTQTSPCIQRP